MTTCKHCGKEIEQEDCEAWCHVATQLYSCKNGTMAEPSTEPAENENGGEVALKKALSFTSEEQCKIDQLIEHGESAAKSQMRFGPVSAYSGYSNDQLFDALTASQPARGSRTQIPKQGA